MFSTSGYFRGVNCPYFASGLCERPYCHLRHVHQDDKGKTILTVWGSRKSGLCQTCEDDRSVQMKLVTKYLYLSHEYTERTTHRHLVLK